MGDSDGDGRDSAWRGCRCPLSAAGCALPLRAPRRRCRLPAAGCRLPALRSEALQLALFREPAQRAALELAHALGGEIHPLGDLAQRQRLSAADPEAQLNDLARVRVEPLERLADRRLLELHGHLL